MKERRVVVTGMGTVNALGNTIEEYWKNLVEGKPGISKIDRFDASELPSQVAGQVKNFEAKNYIDFKLAKRMDIFTQFGVAASNMALEDAGITGEAKEKIDHNKVGCNVGSGIGGFPSFSDNYEKFLSGGWKKVSPFFIPMIITNILPGTICMLNKFHGPSYSMSSACATSNHTITDAFYNIKNNICDVMVTGGSEGSLIPIAIAGFCSARALSTKRNDDAGKSSRPFDSDRDGFVMAEGAGVIILEELEHARKRGAKILAELVGVGASSDAHHLTEPHPDGYGACLSMQNAMNCAGIKPEQISYINSHGTSTPVGDPAEVKAIKKAFGDHASKLKVNSTKSMIGHLLGAAGGVESIALILQMNNNRVHPTINIENIDENCSGLDFVVGKTQELEIEYAMSNSFGFGGQNSTLVYKKFND